VSSESGKVFSVPKMSEVISVVSVVITVQFV